MSDLLQSALKLGRNKEIAREEYLVATGQKEPAAFTVFPSVIELSDLSEPKEVTLQIGVISSGYLEIEAYCPDDFVSLSRRMISSDVFSENHFEFTFTILPERLHGGMNYSCITFGTALQEIKVDVQVDVPIKITLDGYNPKQTIIELAKIYFDFRKGMMDSSDWARRSLEIIGSVDGNDRQSMFLMLFKAQLNIELEEFVDAANILEYVADMLQRLPYTDRSMNAYFSYVRALYERDKGVTEEIRSRIRAAYTRNPCWQMLWILFQMDSVYVESPGLKLDDISNEFDAGCKSPILYLEALEVFLQYPGFLSDASSFELQILNFAVKIGCCTSSLSARVTEVFLKTKNLVLCEKITKSLYEQFPTRDLLRAVCRILIAKDDRSKEAGQYYNTAVKEYIDDIPDIFNYYLYR